MGKGRKCTTNKGRGKGQEGNNTAAAKAKNSNQPKPANSTEQQRTQPMTAAQKRRATIAKKRAAIEKQQEKEQRQKQLEEVALRGRDDSAIDSSDDCDLADLPVAKKNSTDSYNAGTSGLPLDSSSE